MHVLAKSPATAQVAVVGVEVSRGVVIIAGAEVNVTNQLAGFTSHDQRHFRVCFESDEAVHNVCASLLQPVGQGNVGCLVEARHEFDDDRHFLAGSSGSHQVVNNGRVGAGSIQRDFYRENIVVGRGGADEINRRREGLVRMMKQYILFRQERKNIFIAAKFLRQSLHEWRVQKFRLVLDLAHHGEAVQIHRAVNEIHVVFVEAEMV